MATKRKSTKSAPKDAVGPMEDLSWRARDDLSTLTRAQEISADRSRLAAARREAQKQASSLNKISAKLGGRKI